MELARFPSRGGFSVRSIILFVLVVLSAALLALGPLSSQVLAADPAQWSNNTILFDSHSFNADGSFDDATGTIPDDATAYVSPPQNVAGGSQKIFVIYFSSGVDPPTATSADYVEFTLDTNGDTTNPENQQSITLLTQSQSQTAGSSCAITGIGWLICTFSNFIADGMDTVFGWIDDFIAVQPLVLGNVDDSMYIAWNIMRSFANVAFVIAFLIIIYSQLTNFGVSNYGLKRLIPRLVVAAVLVNLSFHISALAIDLSNIAGYSLQTLFNAIREGVFFMTNDTLENNAFLTEDAWMTVTSIVLAGGGAIGGVYFYASGAIYALFPILLMLFLTVILVLVVLAARQAIIVILVIVAPLAFVANLLPNTEKWFNKWRDLFMTMLIFFPAFSLVYGGSQLAGQIIIQSASGDGDSIVMLIFGMAVQVAPLVITPLLLKLSGGLLGKIMQIANNPRKGLIDRSRSWANDRAELKYNKNAGKNLAGRSRLNPFLMGSRMVKSREFRRRRLKDNIDVAKQNTENRYKETRGNVRIEERMAGAQSDKENIANTNATRIESLKVRPGSSLYQRTLNLEASKDKLTTAQNRTKTHLNYQRALGGSALNATDHTLDLSKINLEDSEKILESHRIDRRMVPGSNLHIASEALEASKLRLEGRQSEYTAMVDQFKINPGSEVRAEAIRAQVSKETAEKAQLRVQSMFDDQRRATGSDLNVSTIELNEVQLKAARSKSLTDSYVNAQKVAIGSTLHTAFIEAEQAKFEGERADAALAKIVKEYKSGKIDPAALTPDLTAIMESMNRTAADISAEQQGGEAAQREIQKSIADQFRGDDARAEELLDIAQSVGGQVARVRAEARAVQSLEKLDDDALSATVDLLKVEAMEAESNINNYSKDIISAFRRGDTEFNGKEITPELLKAAVQAQAEEKNMSLFEEMLGDRTMDQNMLAATIARNRSAFKQAGGFHMQANPDLRIDHMTEEEFKEQMAYGRIQSLVGASPKGLQDLKFGWVLEMAKSQKDADGNEIPGTSKIEQSIEAALADPLLGEDYIRGAYKSVNLALNNPELKGTIGDREMQIRKIEAILARHLGVEPTPDDLPQA